MGDQIGVGIIGLGVVGGGVYRTLVDHAASIASRAGVEIAIARVTTRTPAKAADLGIPDDLWAPDIKSLIADPGVDIVVELIGGETVAKDITYSAFEAGKSVVSANKALIADEGPALLKAAAASRVDYLFEAAVCGGIPILRALREGLAADRISQLYGIVNGTCNYILTKMTEDEAEFEDALREAQAKGFAEADPTLDVTGVDAAHKAAILASIVSQSPVSPKKVYTEGITKITPLDIATAEEMGYTIKLLAIVEIANGAVDCRVHPTMVHEEALLSHVRNEFNAVWLRGDVVGEFLQYGRGAGRFPTASAVVGDIIDAARNVAGGSAHRVPPFIFSNDTCLLPIESVVCPFYLRFTVGDEPGVLGRIATILGEHQVGIAQVVQHGKGQGETVPIFVLTHAAKEARLRLALSVIDRLPEIKAHTCVIRGLS